MPSDIIPPHFYGFDETVYEVALHEPGGGVERVPEALVQDLWRTQRFNATGLTASNGAAIDIVDPGRLNTDSGPDFSGAVLRLGGVEWRGDVEIHTASSGWFDHRHHLDVRYNAVVLHVALQADIWTGGLLRADGTPIPELILYPHLQAPLRKLIHDFYTRPAHDLLCAPRWREVPPDVRDPWVDHLAAERVREKTLRLAQASLSPADLPQLLHEHLFAGLGYAKNDEPMRSLARRLPLALTANLPDARDLEALHFGVAGLLPAPADLLQSDRATADYVMDLRERFDRLRHRFEVPAMEKTSWRFFRLRPANFPTLRLAQGIALVAPGGLLREDPAGTLRAALESADPVSALRKVLRAQPSAFWNTHVRLETATRSRNAALGRSRTDTLIVNAVAPVMLLYAERTGNARLEAAVWDVLRRLPPTPDEVTRRFKALGTRPRSALEAQGLHQLYRTRCSEARCLTCPIGVFLLDVR